jgi:hypothetical protein
VGISVISEEEAQHLQNPTLAVPGTKKYLVQLDVWHELHCLNDIRKLLYPERFHMLEDITIDGIIDRDNDGFRHWGKPTFACLVLPAPLRESRSLHRLDPSSINVSRRHCSNSIPYQHSSKCGYLS